ncbi:MAG: hypothetical protein NT079_05795 [Candidatus Omnitrophica bacterium]|nr:hypothetical protein [Candidatus Omnitrophota bacterium]
MKKTTQQTKNKGSVLITVIMLILAMMALAIGILSALGSQGLLGQNQVSRIRADQLAKGYFWRYYFQTANSGTSAPFTGTEVLDGQTYTITQTVTSIPPGPWGTNTITTTVHQ